MKRHTTMKAATTTLLLLLMPCIQHVAAQGTQTIGSGAHVTMGEGATLRLASAWVNEGTFSAGDGTVIFTGEGDQVLTPAPGESFFNLIVAKPGGILLLQGDIAVDGTLALAGGGLDLDGNTIDLGVTGTLAETPANTVFGAEGTITAQRTLSAPTAENVAGLGAEITSPADLGVTTVTRGHAPQDVNGMPGIARYFDIAPATNSGLDATLVFHYADTETGGLTEADLLLFRSTDEGSTWTLQGGMADPAANTLTLDGINAFSRWTAGLAAAPPPISCADAVIRILDFRAAISTQQWVRIGHDEAGSVDFSGCHMAAILGRTDRSTFTTPLGGIVAPDESLLVGSAAVPEVDIVIPDKTIHASRSAIYLLTVPMPPGTRPFQVAAFIKAGVTYFDENQWYSQYPPPAASKTGTDLDLFIASLAEIQEELPTSYSLEQNYPNPFNPSTVIAFSLPEAAYVELTMFDVVGRQVATLVAEPMEAGRHTRIWDGRAGSGHQVSSGMYIYRIRAGDFTATRRLILLE